MVLRFDPDQWRAAGRPGAVFGAFPDPRSAQLPQLFGGVIGPAGVGAAVGVGSRAVKNWAEQSASLIESWRWEHETLEDPTAGLRLIVRQLEGLEPLPEPKYDSWEWIPLPSDAAPRLSENVLLRAFPPTGSTRDRHPLARDTASPTVGFAIVRSPIGNGRRAGRGCGWLFRRAEIPPRWGLEALPAWLSRA